MRIEDKKTRMMVAIAIRYFIYGNKGTVNITHKDKQILKGVLRMCET